MVWRHEMEIDRICLRNTWNEISELPFRVGSFQYESWQNKIPAVTVHPTITKILVFCATDSKVFSNFYIISKTNPIQRNTDWFRLWTQRASCNRYSSQLIDTQAIISTLKPTYRYSRQYIETQFTISIFKPTYRYLNHHIDTQTNVSILKAIYRYSIHYICIPPKISILKSLYRQSHQRTDTTANISVHKPTYRY